LSTQSATTTISHAVTVAGGVFDPGHLGELTQHLPFELVDDVLGYMDWHRSDGRHFGNLQAQR
jgi:hypothetical protein